ncbi:hypothetical protein HZC21_03430, partial [Candidatus Peregrinibacteria bacterium]|nr:hypothetical protein [Candidatus Peregrinibacteria bacterium]
QAAIAAGSPVIGLTVYKHPRAIIPLLEAGAIRVFVDWREINIPALIRNLNEEV